jgi:hypothetical protein
VLLKASGPVVTFMHHPYYFLHESEHIAPGVFGKKSDTNNNFSKLIKAADILLSGHVHGDLQDPTVLQQHAYAITNGTSYTTDSWNGKCYPYTYAMLKINKQLKSFAVQKYEYDGEKKDGAAFVPTHDTHLTFYDFSFRKELGETSLETEKVRVLDHFAALHPGKGNQQRNDFFLYQMCLYDEAIEQIYKTTARVKGNNRQAIEFTTSRNKRLPDKLTVKINGQKIAVILLFDGPDPSKDIISFFKSGKWTEITEDKVFLSVRRQSLLKNNNPVMTQIDKLRTYFRTYALAVKRRGMCIDLLYH